MILRPIRSLSRSFSTLRNYYEEHYQYPGNPSNEEFTKWANSNQKTYVQDTTIYKPKDQIEFNRTGELLLYEAEVFRIKPVYFPYPHSLMLQANPIFLYMYIVNPLHLLWNYNNLFVWASIFSFYPMVEYYYDLRFHLNQSVEGRKSTQSGTFKCGRQQVENLDIY